MSLHPFVCKYFKFPVGQPVIHVGDACRDTESMLQKEGLTKCIPPPRTLYHPMLPFRCNGKLLFWLCKTCATKQSTEDPCPHEAVADKALTATWVIDEIRLAVGKGYRVVEVYEVYENKITQYDPATEQGGLFVEYIKTFLKLKAEVSGYPSWVRTSEDEDSYINALMASEVIRLERNNIRPNAARRALTKLCLNSKWGKLTESNHRTMTELISKTQEFV